MKNDFVTYFNHYLEQIENEVKSYTNESDLWFAKGDVKNSAGNLALHILGNLNHFIGKALAGTGYERNRDAEFENKNISRSEILDEIEHTKDLISKTLPHLNNLTDEYPEGYWHDSGSIHLQLLKLLSHLAYHAGQINYHRRGLVKE
jgi:hypothetical protein